MEALERLAWLLVQQHGMAQGGGAAPVAAPSGSPVPAPAAAQPLNSWRGPFDAVANGGAPKNGGSAEAAAAEAAAAATSGGEAPRSTTGASGEAGQVSSLTAALASLLTQRAAEADALLPSSLDAMSRDSSREYASAAAAAVAAAAGEAEDPAARGRQLELAKSIAQVIITHLQRHPSCMALKQMGAALSETLLNLGHPQAAVDRLLTNATYMSRLHVNQSMAHDLLPDVEDSLQAKEPARQGTGASVTLFKHSIVVVDEQDRAWPVQYEGFMSAGQRHLRLGAGWRYMCRANNAAVGDTMVLERWTQDRSVLHVRILRSAPQAPLPDLGQLPVLPSLPLSGGGAGLPPVTTLPPALQAMLGVAAEAAAAEALKNDTTLPPLPTLSLLPELEPQQPAQQQQQQAQQQQQQQQEPPMQQEQTPAGGPTPAAAAAAAAPSAANSSRMGASGGNSASNLSEPTPPASADQADVPMQQPASDAAAGI
ncbi:hypothetical protein COHA_001792 [Chlorella ohadii]|uniref:TF-B3 domain-containing protein n=1 Tax=Chlorella ohadii TaxID=2649997 RepID=A0AAD5DYJ6_9CHLO|nr:hypothetical protein COHA_001792 [Chlorella ohadii]